MFERRSMSWPITLGVVMIVLVVVLTIGWVLMSLIAALYNTEHAAFFLTWLAIGATLLVMVLVGVVLYLTLSLKAISLTRRQSNFIDSVTHELKSPIASLKLYLQTLHRRNVTAAEREDFYRFMLEDVERLDSLVSNLLDVARFDRGKHSGEVEDVLLVNVLRGCIEPTCLRHGVPSSTVELDIEPCLVIARRVELEMVFRNLIDNAIKYGGDVPLVQIRSRIVPGRKAGQTQACVEVSDNGRGVPQSMRWHIFGRFVRLGEELEREKPGTGLGLYIVRTLVERLRGKIRVHDRVGESGSTFEVYLPCKPISANAPAVNDDSHASASV